ncbi:mandelate racemase/muconate lactonizing enzyme family protein [Thermovenabulum gondwanense]|uniref:L-Ala-D/L-Glu epimerase n=1 Tax=Thermovenabulum gondwanense TaxID=520767 RepID=A0A162MQ31_9FIRM|nr:mandelate racemase/muconate lactonizing enzyme family protein [Thermovenabulum gondwanense]KYO66919.1 L-Ala-D/L-Glu epimerase [Thermovenabulum gondwanense]
MDQAIYGNYAAKACVYELLGGKVRDDIELTWVVGIKEDLKDAVKEAEYYVNMGYKVIKLKVGNSPEKDYQLVETIRNYFGDRIKIRLDANQGYDYPTSLKLFQELEKFNIESIEQPVKRWDIEGLRKFREKLKTPIMADEAVSNFHDVYNVVSNNAADIVNIKVGKVGGLLPAKKISNVIESAELRATAGSNLELGIGIAASIHFVASSKVLSYPHDLYIGIDLHENDIIKRGFNFVDGKVKCPELPGLGVEVDTEIFRS